MAIGGAEPDAITDVVRHARELLDIIETESAEQSISMPSDARAVLAQLRGRLESLERDIIPTRH